MKSFLKLAAESRVKNNNLLKIEEIIDWHQLRLLLKKIERSGLRLVGYNTRKLLKALILQSLYSLSDTELEEALQVRMDFLLFPNLDENVPDTSTLCMF